MFQRVTLEGFVADDPPNRVTFVDDERFVVSSTRAARLVEGDAWRALPHGGAWYPSADGRSLVGFASGAAIILDARTLQRTATVPRTLAGAASLADDTLAVARSASFDKWRVTVHRVSAPNDKPRTLEGPQSIPGAEVALVGGEVAVLAHAAEQGPVLFVDGAVRRAFGFDAPTRFAFSPSGVAVASGVVDDQPIVAVQGAATMTIAAPRGVDAYVQALSASHEHVALTVGPANGPGAIEVLDHAGRSILRFDQPADDWLEAGTVALSPSGAALLWLRSGGRLALGRTRA